MDAQLLKLAGQVAGIGGLSLGVLLLVFRDVVRRNIFPNLAQVQAYRLLRLIVVLTFAIAAIGIVAWVTVNHRTNREIVEFPTLSPTGAIERHLALVDANQLAEAWRGMADEAHRRMQYDVVKQVYEAQRLPLGKPVRRTALGITSMEQLPDQTRGAFALATYVSEFEKGRYVEAVTTTAEKGVWKVLFHQLAPCTPQICGN